MTEKNTKNGSRKDEERDSTALALPGLGFPSVFGDFMKPFEKLMEPFFPASMRSYWTELGEKEPIIDFQDRGDHFVLTAELPGFEKKDVEVRVSDNALELKAERKSEKADDKESRTSYSSFRRYLTLPDRVLSERVDGTMKNGVLQLKLPKKEPKPMDKSRRVALK